MICVIIYTKIYAMFYLSFCIKFCPVGGFNPRTMGEERNAFGPRKIQDEATAGTTTGTMWD